jgi:hypothetical protein
MTLQGREIPAPLGSLMIQEHVHWYECHGIGRVRFKLRYGEEDDREMRQR